MLSMENLTRTEKLRMMEVIWDDLSRDTETLSSSEQTIQVWRVLDCRQKPSRIADALRT